MEPSSFFLFPGNVAHKQYEALRMYFIDGKTAREVAERFGYTYRAFTSLVAFFRKKFASDMSSSLFFVENQPGRKVSEETKDARSMIIEMRKKYYSVPDIKVTLDAAGHVLSEKNIYNIVSSEGFSRLPRRTRLVRQQLDRIEMVAGKGEALSFETEEFKSSNAGILVFLPLIKRYGIDGIIGRSAYPSTSQISKLSSILCFLALKLSNRRRYPSDDTWCMDRGMGLFAGLNMLPKTAWFTSYSDLENNWSGKRGKALGSMLAVLAHDPQSGLIDYGNTDILQKDESAVILEFLDFYREGNPATDPLRYLVFDSRFTNYENLNKLNRSGVQFITIRRRGQKMIEQIEQLPAVGWKNVKVECGGNKQRTLRVYDDMVVLKGYDGKIRQIIITGHGKIKPAILITNDLDLPIETIIRKYSRRWIVEKTISGQIEFFHLNLVSSSMVIKVDFDLTMSILAHNLYRLLAMELERFENFSVQRLYEKFVFNGADIKIEKQVIRVLLKKKRTLPLILETMQYFSKQKYDWLANKKLIFEGASYS